MNDAPPWAANSFSGPTASGPVLITNATMDSPFEAMHRVGWGVALVPRARRLGGEKTPRFRVYGMEMSERFSESRGRMPEIPRF